MQYIFYYYIQDSCIMQQNYYIRYDKYYKETDCKISNKYHGNRINSPYRHIPKFIFGFLTQFPFRSILGVHVSLRPILDNLHREKVVSAILEKDLSQGKFKSLLRHSSLTLHVGRVRSKDRDKTLILLSIRKSTIHSPT